MVIIDVRSKAEYDTGHVEGALWFDVERIGSGELPDIPKDEEIILYCQSGNRSAIAGHIMKAKGFTNVRNAGGLVQMAAAGHEIAR